jgi:hypothetical protein
MGGTDVAENLVEITVTQHAMFHFCNYQLCGNEEDKIAWRMLGKQITLNEAKLEAVKLGQSKGREVQKKLYEDEEYKEKHIQRCKKSFQNSPHKDKIINTLLKNQSKAVEASKTPEAIEKKKKKFKETKHQQGEKNSQYGKIWITNGTKEGTYRINKGEIIPKGYWEGRVCFNEENLNYIYTIITPEGKTIVTKNLNTYCEQNDLSYNCMRHICIGNQNFHKGYTVAREPINTHKIS